MGTRKSRVDNGPKKNLINTNIDTHYPTSANFLIKFLVTIGLCLSREGIAVLITGYQYGQ